MGQSLRRRREAHHRFARSTRAPCHRDRHQGKELSNEKEGRQGEDDRTPNECRLAQNRSQGVEIKPPGGSVSDRRSGSVSERRQQGSFNVAIHRRLLATLWLSAPMNRSSFMPKIARMSFIHAFFKLMIARMSFIHDRFRLIIA